MYHYVDGATSVNADTDFARDPPVERGHVIKVVLLRVMNLRQGHSAAASIVITEIQTESFRSS